MVFGYDSEKGYVLVNIVDGDVKMCWVVFGESWV